MTDLVVRPAEPGVLPADRLVLERLWNLFRHDMSAFTGSLPSPDGTFRSDRLRTALTEPGWASYLFHQYDRPIGFALVRNLDGPGPTVLAGFFLVNGARRQGHGLSAALNVLRRHPGDWDVAFQDENAAAVAFWPRVAEAAAPGAWHLEHRPVPGRPEIPDDAWISFTVGPGR
jgi:predicted acetyltransferase